VWLEGTLTRVWMFVMRLSASGRAFHWAFGNECGESFYEGHNLAFDHFGGVPVRIRYDNLKPAVVKVLLGRERWENPKFVALRSHYGFESFFCMPGIEGPMRRAGWRARSAGSVAAGWSPSPGSVRWTSSTC
jgi:transposase